MPSSLPTLRLLIVSDDWVSATLLRGAAEQTARFERISAASESSSALTRTWQLADAGSAPNVFFIDVDSVGRGAGRLVSELRRAIQLGDVFIAAFSGSEPPAVAGVDLTTASAWREEQLGPVMSQVADMATAILTPRGGLTAKRSRGGEQ